MFTHPDTGDRPYKCQHCGDAFARSDLLSRHVNKCHSAEKAAAIAAAVAAAQVLGYEVPEYVLTLLAALGLYGVRSAIGK